MHSLAIRTVYPPSPSSTIIVDLLFPSLSYAVSADYLRVNSLIVAFLYTLLLDQTMGSILFPAVSVSVSDSGRDSVFVTTLIHQRVSAWIVRLL